MERSDSSDVPISGMTLALPARAFVVITVSGLVAAGCTYASERPTRSAPPATQSRPPTTGAVAYDAARKVVLLVTPGASRTNPEVETWTWDGSLWTRQRPAVSPPARSETALVYDESRRVTLLQGGIGSTGNLDDTWEWDGANWSLRHPLHAPPPVPPGQEPGSMAYDRVGHRVLLYQIPQQAWSWDGNDWTQLHPAHVPGILQGQLAFDGKQVILVGGSSDGGHVETWSWRGTDWTLVASGHTPGLAPLEPMASFGGAGMVVLYGGGPGDDTWTWDGSSWKREHPAHSPVSESPPRLVDDRALNRVIALAGGFQGPITGLYAWNGSDWSAIGPGTPATAPAGNQLVPVTDAAARIRHTVINTTPVLLPQFPSGVDQALLNVNPGSFSLKAWNDDRSIEIDLAIAVPGNSNLGAANATIPFRRTAAYYQYIAGDPSGWRDVFWTEPAGHWAGDNALPPMNGVPYILSASGLTETEFFALGNSLR